MTDRRPLLVLTMAMAIGGVAWGVHAQRAAAPSPAPPAAGSQAARPGAVPSHPPLATGAALSPRNANYTIDATLDPASRTITGRAVITWRNITSKPAPDVRLHLYWNAWRNAQSTWLRERRLAGADAALFNRPERDWAAIDLSSLRVLGVGSATPIDLLPASRFVAPDDGNADDRTLLAVPLPSPVGPGETINLDVAWTARIPRTFARTGAIGDFFFIAQWFPKVAVLSEGGWRAHQFHAGTEFFADFGVYDVRLTLPARFVVGATGLEQGRQENADRSVTHRFVQADVHDFVWTASPDFVERRARFEHAGLPQVEMRLLLQPEHAGQADRHFEATRAALRYYGEWFGPYPYGHITIVDPAWQSGAGGMEYPTLFTAGTRWLAPRHVMQPESVTVHEAGHQFWYGLVANNEVEHAWLDEGLNTFSTARTLAAAYSRRHPALRFFGGFIPWRLDDVLLDREIEGNRLAGYRPAARSDAQSTPTFQYFPATGARISYDKTALWLQTLENMLGWEVLQRILSTFFARHAFRHPTPDDFFAVANEVSGQDLTWFFDEVHRSARVFDYAVRDLRSERRSVKGFVEREGGARVFADEPAAGGGYETTVVVQRLGDARFPVDVVVTFEDGQAVRQRWNGRERWKAYTLTSATRAVSAVVDPERVLVLDVNYTNNSRTLAPRAEDAAVKWSLAWLTWLQDLMLTYGFFV